MYDIKTYPEITTNVLRDLPKDGKADLHALQAKISHLQIPRIWTTTTVRVRCSMVLVSQNTSSARSKTGKT